MNRLRDLFCYAGISKEDYSLIADDIRHYNRKSLGIYSALSAFLSLVLFFISLGENSIVASTTQLYACAAAAFFLIHIINLIFVDRNSIVLRISGYFFIAFLFSLGILLAAVHANDISVTYMVFLLALPLLLILRPIHLDAIVILAEIVYICCMYRLNDTRVFRINLLNAIIYGIVGIIISNSMLAMKIHKYQTDNQNKKLMRTDILTELLNRHAYTETFLSYSEKPLEPNLVYIAMDMNGLKKTNDTRGHLAGDELIVAAASCIKKAFGQYGNLYRTGGDEFIAVLQAAESDIKDAAAVLENEIASYNKTHDDLLSISLGYATVADLEESSFKELSHLADKRMYQNKNDYYKRTGKDRRK